MAINDSSKAQHSSHQEAGSSMNLEIRIAYASTEKGRVGLRVALVIKPGHIGMTS